MSTLEELLGEIEARINAPFECDVDTIVNWRDEVMLSEWAKVAHDDRARLLAALRLASDLLAELDGSSDAPEAAREDIRRVLAGET